MWKQTLRQSNLLQILCQKLTVSFNTYFRMVTLCDSDAGITPGKPKALEKLDN